MTTLTNTINEMTATLGWTTIELISSVSSHNMRNEDELIETDDEIRQYLVEVAYNSRMTRGGKEKYSAICKINDAYFKAKLAA